MTKKKLIGCIIGAVCFVAVLLVATFYDLEINKALGNADSVYGQFFRLFGELTGWIVVPFATAFLFQATWRKNKIAVVIGIFWIVATFAGWFLTVDYVLKEFTGAAYAKGFFTTPYRAVKLYAAVFGALLTACTIFGTARLKKETVYKLAMFAAAILLALAISQIFTNLLKVMWSRQRFRNLPIGNGGTDSTGFTPWYHPNFGKNKGVYYFPDSAGMKESGAYTSFPSGHTAGAALTFVFVMLPDLFEKLKKYKICFYAFAIVYTVAVAISRIVNRAHYLSDTLFGGYIGMLSSFAAIAITYKVSAWGNKKFARLIPTSAPQEEVAPEAPAEDSAEKAENSFLSLAGSGTSSRIRIP